MLKLITETMLQNHNVIVNTHQIFCSFIFIDLKYILVLQVCILIHN